MWKFIADVVHDFGCSLRPDVGRCFLHVSNVSLLFIVNVSVCFVTMFVIFTVVLSFQSSSVTNIIIIIECILSLF